MLKDKKYKQSAIMKSNMKIVLCLLILVAVVFVSTPVDAMQINIEIETHDPQHLSLDVETTERVEDVKSQIYNETGISTELQLLYFNDTLLEDGNTLQDYSVQKDDTLTLNIMEDNGESGNGLNPSVL